MKLIIPTEVARRIFEVVYQTGLETGVTLFGERAGEDFTVKHIAGPGPEATHEELHYSGNEDYATMVFNELLKDDPNLKHIGELHVHPFMMKRLSQGDRDTVKELLKEYEEFIAGVILRNHLWDFKVYPVYFSRSQPEGIEMEVRFERTRRNRWARFGRKRRH